MSCPRLLRTLMHLSGAACLAASGVQAGEVYRCPGNPVLYTDQLSAKDARDKGCRTVEGAPITVIQAPKPREAAPAPGRAPAAAQPAGALPVERISPVIQRARDADRRLILENELSREELALASLQKEFNGGEPERRGDERNYQKYLERVTELKGSIVRKENDVAAIKRELAKLPQ